MNHHEKKKKIEHKNVWKKYEYYNERNFLLGGKLLSMCTSNKPEKKRPKKKEEEGKQRRNKNGRYKRRRLNTSNNFIFGKNDLKGPRLMEKEKEMRLDEWKRETRPMGEMYEEIRRASRRKRVDTRSKFGRANSKTAALPSVSLSSRRSASPSLRKRRRRRWRRWRRWRRENDADEPPPPPPPHPKNRTTFSPAASSTANHRHSFLLHRATIAEAIESVKISKHFSRHQAPSKVSRYPKSPVSIDQKWA